MQVDQTASLHVEDHPVDSQLLPLQPRLLHEGCTCNIKHLLFHVYFHQQLRLLLQRLQVRKSMSVLMPDPPEF